MDLIVLSRNWTYFIDTISCSLGITVSVRAGICVHAHTCAECVHMHSCMCLCTCLCTRIHACVRACVRAPPLRRARLSAAPWYSDADPCDSSPCVGLAMCILAEDNAAFSCLCSNGFTGEQCEKIGRFKVQTHKGQLDFTKACVWFLGAAT